MPHDPMRELPPGESPGVLIHLCEHVAGSGARRYAAEVWGRARSDGTWEGWLAFVPIRRGGATLFTDRETTQPSRATLLYWAVGLEPVYLEGALQRARWRVEASDART